MSEELKTLININFPDNLTRDIKASNARAVMHAIVDEMDELTYTFGDISGSVANAQLSGTYSNASIKTSLANSIYSVPSGLSPSTNARTVINLAEFRSNASNTVGAIVFSAPSNALNIMFQLEINIMSYDNSLGKSTKLTVQGMLSDTLVWQNLSKSVLGLDVNVRFGRRADGKVCVIIGEVNTSWAYPHINIAMAMFSHNVSDAYCTNWSTEIVTSLTGFTNLTSNLVNTSSSFTTTEKNKLNGIEAGAQVNLPIGDTSGTVTAGNDSRLLFSGADFPIIGNCSVTDDSIVQGSYAYQTANGSTGGPSGVLNGTLIHNRNSPGNGEFQLLLSNSDSIIWSRSRLAGTWSVWREVNPIDDPWEYQPIGVPIPLLDNMIGVLEPPTNKDYRYIKLTASDAYNDGVLTSESITGSAPLIIATAVISLLNSPINNEVINLINTERRFLRAGNPGITENDQMQQITGDLVSMRRSTNEAGMFAGSGGAFTYNGLDGGSTHSLATAGVVTGRAVAGFDSANSPGARTGTETRAKNLGATYYMRIL